MKQKSHGVDTQTALAVAAVLAVIAGILFFLPFLGVITTAIILAFSFSPVHNWFARKLKKRAYLAAPLTLTTALCVVVLPIILLLSITVLQTRDLVAQLQVSVSEIIVNQDSGQVIPRLQQSIATISGGVIEPSEQDIIDYASTAGITFANGLLRMVTALVSSVPAMMTAIVLFIYVFIAILTYQKAILAFLKALNPFGDELYERYLERASAMTNGMVRGQFIIALAQGAIGTLTFAIVGIPYLAFFFLILSFLSLIPLGSGIISFPLGIFLLLTGNIWQGAVILLGHLIVVNNIDTILRPVLIPKAARLPAVLTLLGVFSGLAMFGFLGVIVGPIIVILLLTTLQVYLKARQDGGIRAT